MGQVPHHDDKIEPLGQRRQGELERVGRGGIRHSHHEQDGELPLERRHGRVLQVAPLVGKDPRDGGHDAGLVSTDGAQEAAVHEQTPYCARPCTVPGPARFRAAHCSRPRTVPDPARLRTRCSPGAALLPTLHGPASRATRPLHLPRPAHDTLGAPWEKSAAGPSSVWHHETGCRALADRYVRW